MFPRQTLEPHLLRFQLCSPGEVPHRSSLFSELRRTPTSWSG